MDKIKSMRLESTGTVAECLIYTGPPIDWLEFLRQGLGPGFYFPAKTVSGLPGRGPREKKNHTSQLNIGYHPK